MHAIDVPTRRAAKITKVEIESSIGVGVEEVVLGSEIGMNDAFLMRILRCFCSLSAPFHTQGYVNRLVVIEIRLKVAASGLDEE